MGQVRAGGRYGWTLGLAVLAWASLGQAGFAEQPLRQLPRDVVSVSLAWVALPQTMVAVTKDHGPLAGVSWGVIEGVAGVMKRTLKPAELDPWFEGRTTARAPVERSAEADPGQLSWLNTRDAGAREASREPALLRYTF